MFKPVYNFQAMEENECLQLTCLLMFPYVFVCKSISGI